MYKNHLRQAQLLHLKNFVNKSTPKELIQALQKTLVTKDWKTYDFIRKEGFSKINGITLSRVDRLNLQQELAILDGKSNKFTERCIGF